MRWDVFIAHASEDSGFCGLLAQALIRRGVKVWLDDIILKVGDSLRSTIDEGLAESSYGIVVLSEAFFRKRWPKRELDALVAKENAGRKVIIPIWHKVSEERVGKFSPVLRDRLAIVVETDSSDSLDVCVEQIIEVIGTPQRRSSARKSPTAAEERPSQRGSPSRKRPTATEDRASQPPSRPVPDVPTTCECCAERAGSLVSETSPDGYALVHVSLSQDCQFRYHNWRTDPATQIRHPEIRYQPDVKAFIAEKGKTPLLNDDPESRVSAARKRVQQTYGDSFHGGIALKELADALFDAGRYGEARGRYGAAAGHLAQTSQWDLHAQAEERIKECKAEENAK